MSTPSAELEPPIDTSLAHYLEQRALEVAADKAATPEARETVARLSALRDDLMRHRLDFDREATARRQARGEIYSAARVAAINAMGPDRAALDGTVRDCYLGQADADGVLRAHARIHFGFNLISKRMNLVNFPAELLPAARTMQRREDAFAAAWMAAIDDTAFDAQIRQAQRDALRMLRTASRPIHLNSWPSDAAHDDAAAAVLGKMWGKLDALALTLGAEPLSGFLAVPGEDEAAAVPAERILPTVTVLIDAVQAPGQRFPSKRATVAMLIGLRDRLAALAAVSGRACFDIDL